MVECSPHELSGCEPVPSWSHVNPRPRAGPEQRAPRRPGNHIECRLTPKRVRDMITTHSHEFEYL